MTSRILLLALSLALACPAGAGTLTTRDGKHLAGSLAVGEDRITVMTDSGPQAVPLANVAEADFKAGGAEAAKAGHGLRGDYFAGRSLRQLMLTRVDPAIDYEWSDTLPHPSLAGASREFSARWTGRLRPDHSEKYALIADTDDGVRVWLDGRLVIDRWFDQNGGAAPVEVSLEKDRRYDLRVEYYNGHGAARAVLSWSSPSTPRQVIPAENLYLPAAATSAPAATTQAIRIQTPSTDDGPAFERVLAPDRTGLKGEYFADRELDHLNFIRFDPNIDFHFHPDNPPDPAMSPEGSIRWTGMIEPRFSEEYQFQVEVHRRVRLWVDGKLIIDQWRGEGGEYSSERIALVGGKRVPFKVEYTSPNGFMLCRVRWSSKSQPRETIPPEAFTVAPDEKLSRPVIGMVYPASDAFVAAPQQVALLGAGLSPNGRVTRFQFFGGVNSAWAEFESQPYRYLLNKPAPGVYKVRAKLTDAAGVTALSDFATLTITGKGDGSIKAPWGDFFIANNDLRTPGTASQNGDAFKIDNAVGTLVAESDHDAGQFVIQPLTGDGQIVARVTGVLPGPDDGVAGAMGGVTIRENLKNRCKQFSMLYGQPGEEPVASFARRQDHWMNPVVSEKPSKLPVWFKLARYGQRVYAYTSADGKDWDLFASERFESSSPQVFAGLVAFCSTPGRPASATFDHVRLIPGSPPLESSVKGFVTRGGTFVAADVYAIDENLVRFTRNHAPASIPLNDVARILFKPLLADQAAKLSPGRSGVLMSTGDFLEGDVRSLKEGSVSVSSVLFGLRRVPLADDVTAVLLHDISAERAPYTIATTDGSLYRARGLRPARDGQELQVDDASLGPVTVPMGALSRLRGE